MGIRKQIIGDFLAWEVQALLTNDGDETNQDFVPRGNSSGSSFYDKDCALGGL